MNSATKHYHISGETAVEIASSIESSVRLGAISPGAKLPTIRELAGVLDVSPTTVGAAYKRLQRRGVVQPRGRNGTIVAPRPATAAPAPSPSGSAYADAIDLASGNPDPELLIPIEDLLAYTSMEPPVLYGAPMITSGLAEAVRDRFEHEDIRVPGVTVTNGSLDAIERALGSHLRYGDVVGVEDPTYSATLDLLSALGYQIRPVLIDDEGVLPASLGIVLREGLDALIVTPRAQNPTGAAYTPDRAEELSLLLNQYPELLVIEDDHAADIAGTETIWVGRSSRLWLVVRSLSKSIAPDLRVAVCVGDETTISRISGRFALGPGWVSHHIQRMAAVALRHEAISERLASARSAYAQRRDAMVRSLNEQGIDASGASGFNVWIPVQDEVAVVQGLRSRGYAIAAGARFRQDSPPGVRVTVSNLTLNSVDEVVGALAEVLSHKGMSSGFGTRAG